MNALHGHINRFAVPLIALLIGILTFSSLLSGHDTIHASKASKASASAYIRVNQVGYVTGETKQAVLMATGPESGATFHVVDINTGHAVYTAPIGASRGSWSSTFPNTYLLDFSSVQAVGSYKIQVSGAIAANSPSFKVDTGSHLYATLLPNSLFFYLTQRDGPNVDPKVMKRKPSHLKDEQASIFETPVYINDVLL